MKKYVTAKIEFEDVEVEKALKKVLRLPDNAVMEWRFAVPGPQTDTNSTSGAGGPEGYVGVGYLRGLSVSYDVPPDACG
jgi:hypothetical protein